MNAKRISRWGGVGRASVAVAGVCLTGSVASAATTARGAEFETEFEADKALGTETPAGEAVALGPATTSALAAAAGTTVWEQTLVGYLDKIVARECEECEKAIASGTVKADTNPDWDLDEPATVAAAPNPAAVDADWDLDEAPSVVAKVDPDWDLDEPAIVAAKIDSDWDLEESPIVTAKADVDWDLEEPTVVVTKIDPDWDLEEALIASVSNPDWDIDEPTVDEALAATAREAAKASPKPAPKEDPDWDLEEPTVASAADEVTKVETDDADFDLFP